jgi:VWFA-related protein
MSSRATIRTLATGLLTVLLATIPLPPGPQRAAAAPQEGTPPRKQMPKVEVGIVSLFVTVRDRHNAIVADLSKEDFRVLEDGKEQKVEFFNKEVNLPLTIGLLVDTSGSMSRLLPAEQETATRFLQRVMRKGDLTMLITFDLDADLLTDFTGNIRELEEGLARAQINAPNIPINPGTIPNRQPRGTVLYDAVYVASTDKLAREAGRKAIVVLTDAEDNGSRKKLGEAIEAAQRADTVIHVLLLSDVGGFYLGFGGSGASVARKMAEETGGRMIEVRGEKHLEEAFDQLTQELRSQYVVGYYPTNESRDGGFRKIKVELKRPDLKGLTRRGYYASRK